MEIWLDVIGYEGYYQVSNIGRVKSLERKVVCNSSFRIAKGYMLNAGSDKDGYLKVVLSKDRLRKTVSIHRIQAIAFIPNPLKKPCVNHKNGIKYDNNLSNIEWVTVSENAKHAHKMGLLSTKNGAKVTEKEVLEIRKIGKSMLQKEIAKIYNIHSSTIGYILANKTWKNI